MRFAYTAIVDQSGYSIGRADEGTRGYTPLPAEGRFPCYEDAKKRAEEMNIAMGLDPKDAVLIVLGTMRGVL